MTYFVDVIWTCCEKIQKEQENLRETWHSNSKFKNSRERKLYKKIIISKIQEEFHKKYLKEKKIKISKIQGRFQDIKEIFQKRNVGIEWWIS